MIKPTPNPPETDTTSPYESLDSKTFHEAAERALDHYFNPLLPRNRCSNPTPATSSPPVSTAKSCWPTPAKP